MVRPNDSSPADPGTPAELADTKSWLTREESARLLSVTTRTIKNYERKGLLIPQHVVRVINNRAHEVVVYDPKTLQILAKSLKQQPKASDGEGTDTSNWLTRNQSVEMIGVSTQTLKNYERRGKLHPLKAIRRDERGHEQRVVVYDPKELARLPKGMVPFTQRSAGELEARCFEMFEQGKSFREIVIALRETSDTVHGLHERWLDDGGSSLVITDVLKKTLESLLGPFKDVTELVEIVSAKFSSNNDQAPSLEKADGLS